MHNHTGSVAGLAAAEVLIQQAWLGSMGYPAPLLDSVPVSALRFVGSVSDVPLWADISRGATVLDVRCTSGLDSLIASERVGSTGTVIGIDISDDMLGVARQTMTDARVENVELRLWSGDELPVDDDSIDVAIVNGITDQYIFSPERERLVQELYRVVRRNGIVCAADMVLLKRLSAEERERVADTDLTMAYAQEVSAFAAGFYQAGFADVTLRRVADRVWDGRVLVTKVAEVVARK